MPPKPEQSGLLVGTLRQIFNKTDVDKDGSIDCGELTSLVHCSSPSLLLPPPSAYLAGLQVASLASSMGGIQPELSRPDAMHQLVLAAMTR